MASKDSLKSSISERISAFIDDVATLDVLTLSGTIELTPKTKPKAKAGQAGQAAAGDLNMDNLFTEVMKTLETGDQTRLSVVAYTHAEWDQDSVSYVAEGANPDLVKAHQDTVASSHESRIKALASAADTVKNLF